MNPKQLAYVKRLMKKLLTKDNTYVINQETSPAGDGFNVSLTVEGYISYKDLESISGRKD